jgi:[acyl-carrier-protein] S-malonyltransferase
MIDKMVFMFPGVGSQYAGMGKKFYEDFPIFRQTLEEANDVLNWDLAKMCFLEADKNELAKLENAQLTILANSVGMFRVTMQETGIEPAFCLGHSLGEYSALCCSGVISFPDALALVKQRGEIIGEAAARLDGTMMWVINLDREKVDEICAEFSQPGKEVYVSAYDSPAQTSISGGTEAVMAIAKKMEEAGAIVYPLNFSGPFHSPSMEEAAQRMKQVLEQYSYNDPVYPVIANHNARPYEGKDGVADNLSRQLISPIRWADSIEYAAGQGVTTAVEIGPKDVLKFLVKKSSQAVEAFTVDKDLAALTAKWVIQPDEYLQLIGKCLGIAVSTKNRSDDLEAYEKEVVAPYMKIAEQYEQLKLANKAPSLDQVEEAIGMAHAVMAAKNVPQEEQQLKLKKLYNGKILRKK